jgi:hypothetical protein
MRQKNNIPALNASDSTTHRDILTPVTHSRTKLYFIASALVFGLATSSIAQAQSSANEEFLKITDGKQIPSSLLMKDLSKEWRKVVIEPGEQGGGFSDYYSDAMYRGVLKSLGFGAYFTKGESVQLGNQTFLVTYSVKNNMDRQEFQQAMRRAARGNNQNAGSRKFQPDTKLTLSLLSLKNNGAISNIQPFSPQNEIMGPADFVVASDESLRQIGNHLRNLGPRYQSYGGQGFRITSKQSLQQMMIAYFHAPEDLFTQPGNKQPYAFNEALKNARPDKVLNKNKLVVFYESKVGTDGKRGAVFFDGRSERIPEWKWASVMSVKPQGPTEQSLRAQSMKNL